MKKRLNIENERLTQLKTVHKESINIQHEKVIQQRSQLTSIEAKQEQLFIKANITGVLQKVDVELGQRVSLGEY